MFKSVLYGVGAALLLLMPAKSAALTNNLVQRGDIVTLTAADGYKSYQWQLPSDGFGFMNLPDQTAIDYKFKAYSPAYYRVVAKNAEGKTVYLDTTKVDFKTQVYRNGTNEVSAAQGYVEVNGEAGGGISIPGDSREGTTLGLTNVLSNWSSLSAHAVYYFYHPSGLTDVKLKLTVRVGNIVQFRLLVTNPSIPDKVLVDTYLSVLGTGNEQTIDVYGARSLGGSAYYRYDLQCLQGCSNIQQINRWQFLTSSANPSYVASYLSSPSVHLNGWTSTKAGIPSGRSFDWCYEEVMIPQESDYVGTYAMSLGVLSGYMGIQVNGTSRHDVIFSMWDDGSTDTDPGLPNYKKAGAVDASPDVTVSRFGNEGTGVKTFAAGDWWKLGTYVQFITNARPEVAKYAVVTNGVTDTIVRDNTLVSAWFNAQDGKGWQYIATTRLPGKGHYFDSWYSFLENYSWPSGQKQRKAFYRNGYKHAMESGLWYHCNKVGFGHTDGGTSVGSRTDYGQGQSPDSLNTFFMTNGGYFATNTKANTVPLNKTDTPVDTINIGKLKARVDLAVAKEAAALQEAADMAASTYDKTGWKMLSFSSQETSGENTNGRAAQIIDGDVNTYWHSAWQSGSASLPHWFVVDMLKTQPVNGFQFNLSGGTTRHQKAIEIYGSNDNKTWHLIYQNGSCPDTESYYLKMDSAVNIRYFKLVITSTQSGVVHTRINEIQVTHPITTAISSASIGNKAGGLTIYTNSKGNCINVVSPVNAREIKIEVLGLAGEQRMTTHFYNVVANEVCSFCSGSFGQGVFVVRCTANGKTYSRKVLIQ